MTRGKRVRVAPGIYDDPYGRSAVVKVGRVQREQRFPPGHDLEACKGWQIRTRAELHEDRDETLTIDGPIPERGTYANDLPRYLKMIEGRESYASDRSHLRAWLPFIGPLKRTAIRSAHLKAGFTSWRTAGKSARTLRHRRRVIREMWQGLDGAHAKPPVKGIKLPKPEDPIPVAVPIKTIQKVAASLKAGLTGKKRHGPKRTLSKVHYPVPAAVHARFLIRALTGQRPAQIGRAKPEDVDLKRKIWFVRPAKDGLTIPFPLGPETVEAWKLFAKVKAWGPFDVNNFTKTIRRHGWPEGTRPYSLRSTFAIDHLLAGTTIGELQGLLGHKQIETTRKHYAPVLLARLRKTIGKRKLRFA